MFSSINYFLDLSIWLNVKRKVKKINKGSNKKIIFSYKFILRNFTEISEKIISITPIKKIIIL